MRSKAPVALLLLSLGLAACSGGGGKPAASPSASATATASATPSATPTASALDPLTGTSPRSTGTVLGVKVDNALLARPYQTGLDHAAVVYQELVEGGSTRLLAVFESDLAGPGEVGPIRSVRESDVELVRGYGRMALAFSGGNTGVKAIVHAAVANGYLVDASYDVAPGAYRLGAQRRDARNFFTVPGRLAAVRPGGPVQDAGFRFGPLAPGGVPTAVGTAVYAGTSRVTFRYSAATQTWSIAQDGRLMPGVAPANIIVQRVVERGSRFVDVHGKPTPYTVTTGSGPATVFRDGVRVDATWKRDGYGATHYLASGTDVLLRPGKTWVLLVPTTGSLSFG